MNILAATQQIGNVFNGINGYAQVLLSNAQTGVKYTLQVLYPGSTNSWIDTDVTFSDNGIKTFYMQPDLTYRMHSDASAGDVGAIAMYLGMGFNN